MTETSSQSPRQPNDSPKRESRRSDSRRGDSRRSDSKRGGDSKRGDSRKSESKDKNVKTEMLINVSQPEECRIAVVEDDTLEELYVERASQDNYVGNIYKGKVVNLEPSIQAAFVDFGVGRNGFLHISDVEPSYYRQGGFDPADYATWRKVSFAGAPMPDWVQRDFFEKLPKV